MRPEQRFEVVEQRLKEYIVGRDPSKRNAGMGAFLDKPKTEKTNSCGEGNGVRYSVSQMQGWRVDMEDAHSSVIGMASEGPLKDWSYFAVFDGHAGTKVAQHSSLNMMKTILDSAEMQEVIAELNKNGGKLTEKLSESVKRGIRSGFLHLDEAMKSQPEVYGDSERSGTTAVCCLITPQEFFIANLGDSRAILCKSGQPPFGTEDHKPFLPKERDRIVNAGGSVMIQRVNGSLAVSRALGDYEYKQVPGLQATEQLVSPEPDVYLLKREPNKDEFLILACDGIYDVMTNVELAEFVRSRLQVTHDLPNVGNQILDTCLSKGSRDNMSVVLVTFPGAPEVSDSAKKAEEELHTQLAKRIEGIISMCEKVSEVETDYVLRILINQDIPGIPPGAGIHAVRSQVESILEEIKSKHPKGQKGRATTPQSPSAGNLPPSDPYPTPSDPAPSPNNSSSTTANAS